LEIDLVISKFSVTHVIALFSWLGFFETSPSELVGSFLHFCNRIQKKHILILNLHVLISLHLNAVSPVFQKHKFLRLILRYRSWGKYNILYQTLLFLKQITNTVLKHTLLRILLEQTLLEVILCHITFYNLLLILKVYFFGSL